MDSKCPDMAMFEVDAESGFSNSELIMPVGMVDEVKWPEISESGFSTSEIKMPVGMVGEVKWPEISQDREESQVREDRTFPANGFELNLAIRYDNLFAAQFPGQETTKYFLLL